jgi:DNA-directed RNA polymerase specialized sigma24 family protein
MSQFIRQDLGEALASERVRLVGLCAALTGNVDVAEDLAQEVLLEARRGIERLRDVELFSHWLSGSCWCWCFWVGYLKRRGRRLVRRCYLIW